jgi:ADP-ribose pyrophosphatase YjhB (NUDIX family)
LASPTPTVGEPLHLGFVNRKSRDRRDQDLWNPPGGNLENNEAPWEGVVREVKEEIGLTVKPKRIIDISSKPIQREIVLTFLCLVVRGKLNLSDEADAIAFFALSELPENISLTRSSAWVVGRLCNIKETKACQFFVASGCSVIPTSLV